MGLKGVRNITSGEKSPVQSTVSVDHEYSLGSNITIKLVFSFKKHWHVRRNFLFKFKFKSNFLNIPVSEAKLLKVPLD